MYDIALSGGVLVLLNYILNFISAKVDVENTPSTAKKNVPVSPHAPETR